MPTLNEGWRLTLLIPVEALHPFWKAYEQGREIRITDERSGFTARIQKIEQAKGGWKLSTLQSGQGGEKFNARSKVVLAQILGDPDPCNLCKVKILGGFIPGATIGFGERDPEYDAAIRTHRENLGELEAAIRDGLALVERLSAGGGA